MTHSKCSLKKKNHSKNMYVDKYNKSNSNNVTEKRTLKSNSGINIIFPTKRET